MEFDVLDFDDLKERQKKPQYLKHNMGMYRLIAITKTIAGRKMYSFDFPRSPYEVHQEIEAENQQHDQHIPLRLVHFYRFLFHIKELALLLLEFKLANSDK